MGTKVADLKMSDQANAVNNENPTSPQRCSGLRSCFRSCTRPCLAESHPLPRDAPCWRRLLDNFLCPPHSRAGAILFTVLLAAVGWASLFAMTDDEALPGGNLFSLTVVLFACWCGGYLVDLIRVPPLLGMLLVGVALGNVPHIDFARDVEQHWSSGCRQIALTIILIRAGLGLDPVALHRLSFVVLRLAFLPCLTEAVVAGVSSHFIIGLPLPWGLMLGFVIAAVSPAVVVPSLLALSGKGYGLDKGIPTLVIAAASIDDVLAITGFGVLLSIAFSSGNILWTLAKGPLEALMGIAVGTIGGFILWYVPQKSSKHLLLFRSSLLMLMGLMCLFGSRKIDCAGAGPLAALTLPFVAALRWRAEFWEGEQNPVEHVVDVLWMVFQPLLFGLIGAAVEINSLEGSTVGLGVAVLAIGLAFRALVSYLAVLGTDLSFKERLFIPIAWLPKATVQAAVGGVALDRAKELGDEDYIKRGEQILMLAVLVILITAPIGAMGIALTGPRLLNRGLKSPPIETPIEAPIEMADLQKRANGDMEEGERDESGQVSLIDGKRQV